MAATAATREDAEQTLREFREAVNMTSGEVERWLRSEESRRVGWRHEGESESVGHQSGERIVELLRRKKAEFSEDDFAHMRKVVCYVHRHLAQRPDGDIAHTNWRYSLMNWGHDPTKEE